MTDPVTDPLIGQLTLLLLYARDVPEGGAELHGIVKLGAGSNCACGTAFTTQLTTTGVDEPQLLTELVRYVRTSTEV